MSRHALALVALRAQLFGAAQILKGDDLAEFWKLIDEVNSIRDVVPARRRCTEPGCPGVDGDGCIHTVSL